MKSFHSRLLLITLSVSLLVLVSANFVRAGEDPLKGWDPIKQTGYAVTSNWQGIEVPPFTNVVVTAGTTDLSVHNITFIWHLPEEAPHYGEVAFTDFVDVTQPGHQLTTPNVPPNVPPSIISWANDPDFASITYLFAQSTHVVDATLGDWGVQAIFRDGANNEKGHDSTIVARRATSFNVIPEVPFGTLVITLGMFGALSVYAIRKKHSTTSRIPT